MIIGIGSGAACGGGGCEPRCELGAGSGLCVFTLPPPSCRAGPGCRGGGCLGPLCCARRPGRHRCHGGWRQVHVRARRGERGDPDQEGAHDCLHPRPSPPPAQPSTGFQPSTGVPTHVPPAPSPPRRPRPPARPPPSHVALLCVAPQGAEGVYFFRCNTCIIVAHHDDKIQPGNCLATVAKLGDFLKEQGI